MKARLKTTFERYGKCVVGHIEDAETYEDVKSGFKKWEQTAYSRITHIRIPKEVFERLLKLEAENKSIRYCYEQAKSYNDRLAESCEKNCKKFNMTTRAEAIKEFAELVKNAFPSIAEAVDYFVKEKLSALEKEKGNVKMENNDDVK